MDAVMMKEKLHRFIETLEEKRMMVIYALFEREIEQGDWDYTDAFKAELDRRIHYRSNGGKLISAEEVRMQTKELGTSGIKK